MKTTEFVEEIWIFLSSFCWLWLVDGQASWLARWLAGWRAAAPRWLANQFWEEIIDFADVFLLLAAWVADWPTNLEDPKMFWHPYCLYYMPPSWVVSRSIEYLLMMFCLSYLVKAQRSQIWKYFCYFRIGILLNYLADAIGNAEVFLKNLFSHRVMDRGEPRIKYKV